MSIGEIIIKLRKEKKMTQTELATAAGIKQPYLGQIERGTKTPTLPTAKAIAAVLGVTPNDLCGIKSAK